MKCSNTRERWRTLCYSFDLLWTTANEDNDFSTLTSLIFTTNSLCFLSFHPSLGSHFCPSVNFFFLFPLTSTFLQLSYDHLPHDLFTFPILNSNFTLLFYPSPKSFVSSSSLSFMYFLSLHFLSPHPRKIYIPCISTSLIHNCPFTLLFNSSLISSCPLTFLNLYHSHIVSHHLPKKLEIPPPFNFTIVMLSYCFTPSFLSSYLLPPF